MNKGKTITRLNQQHRAGGTYGQADISPAAQKSKLETTRAGEPELTPSEPPSPPQSKSGREP